MAKITREKFKTYGNVFDQFTLRNLFTLETKGYFEELKSPISIGKEANIFSAEKKDGTKVIIKIYRLETCDFKKMFEYIKSDPRYIHLKSNRRKVVFAWAQREFRNLMKVREMGVRVPTPIHCMHNILILEHIGNKEAAPKIKDSEFTDKKAQQFYKKTLEYMRKMYKNGMVHGDLSMFNILDANDKPVFIDFSQSTTTKNTEAEELLKRDVRNMHTFFKKIGIECEKEEMEEFIKN